MLAERPQFDLVYADRLASGAGLGVHRHRAVLPFDRDRAGGLGDRHAGEGGPGEDLAAVHQATETLSGPRRG